CHAGERPASTASWTSATYTNAPFDYVTNSHNVAHGDGQDCAVCHRDTSKWVGGAFAHGPTTVSGTTCVACHTTQRPTAPVALGDGGTFDHATSGSGDCFGCHQATSQFTQLADWRGGQSYPGANLISSSDQFITTTEIALKRGGPNNLVTGTSTISATLNNA